MAIYRYEARIIGRADNAIGRSVVATAAYRAGEKLKDEKYSTTHDYTRRDAGIVHTEILTPENAPAFASDREALWNAVERKEDESTRRKTAQLAREFIVALPAELSQEERKELIQGFAKEELVSRGMVVDLSIHEPKEGLNHHAHLLCTMRDIGPEGFGKKQREWNDTALLEGWRQSWENHCNSALEQAGSTERVDCRSLADRGIDQDPQPKIGVAATALERKGIRTESGERCMWTKMENLVRSAWRGIERSGEVPQIGIGASWWERAQVAIGQAYDYTAESLGELWRDESSGGREAAPVSAEPDLSPSFWQERISQERQNRTSEQSEQQEPTRERSMPEPDMGFGFG